MHRDFVFALRQLRTNLRFSLIIVLTLALGIGATTAIFSVVSGVLLRALPFPESERLISLQTVVSPMLGRSFVLDDERDDSRPIILSHQFWESEFHSSPDIVGKHITVSDRLATVVGVMPAGFSFPDLSHPPSFWGTFWLASASAVNAIGSPQKESVSLAAERTNRAVQVVGRLKPDVSVAQTRA